MKKIVITFIVLLILGILCDCSGSSVLYNREAMLENVQAYSEFAKFCQQFFDGNDKNYSYYYNAENETLFCNTTDKVYQMNKEQAKSAKIVKDTLLIGEQTLENIYVNDNFVSLSTVELRGSFIYSMDDSKPDFVCFPTKKKKNIFVEKITNNWYFVCEQD